MNDQCTRATAASPSVSRIVARRSTDGSVHRVAPEGSVRLSSAGATWDGIDLEHQHLPATQAPEVYLERHLLSVQLTPPSVQRCRGNEGANDRRLAPGDVFFQAAFASGRYSWPDPAEVLNLAVDPALVDRVALELDDRCGAELVGERGGPDPRTRHLAMALQTELQSGEPPAPLFVESVATALAAHLLRHYGSAPPPVPRPPAGLPPRSLRAVRDLVDEHLGSADLSVARMAAQANLSPYHFSRLFRHSTGSSPYQYVLQRRVSRAVDMLTRSDLTIGAVAARCGFSSPTQLARHVRRATGVAPSQVRDLSRNRSAPSTKRRAQTLDGQAG